MMKRTFLFAGLIFLTTACLKERSENSAYLRWVGDIEQDSQLDDPDFKVCSEKNAMQYFNFSEGLPYVGEKYAIEKEFEEQYDSSVAAMESGLVRIRFMVNCEGKSGRFRILGMNFNYEEKQFDDSIMQQLITITRSLGGWKVMPNEKYPKDYYQYLIFKIQDGQIIEILP
jgi:hypothetical protein